MLFLDEDSGADDCYADRHVYVMFGLQVLDFAIIKPKLELELDEKALWWGKMVKSGKNAIHPDELDDMTTKECWIKQGMS